MRKNLKANKMSSIIVLDSSDEDESIIKRKMVTSKTTLPSVKEKRPMIDVNQKIMKPKSQPSITVARFTPSEGIPISSVAAVGKRNSPVQTNRIIKSIQQQQQQFQHQQKLTAIPKINAAYTLNCERTTPTPPKMMPQIPTFQSTFGQMASRRNLPTSALAPQTLNKTSTPISTINSNAIVSTTNSQTNPTLPMISSVHSMAASATPPMQLLATPPHSAAALTDQMLFEQLQLQIDPLALPPVSAESNINPPTSSSNDFCTNFKIHLPLKRARTTPPPISMKSPSPRPATTVSSLPLGSPTINMITSVANTNRQFEKPASILEPPMKQIRRIKPTTLSKNVDLSWLKQSDRKVPSSFDDDDVVMEVTPPYSSAISTIINTKPAMKYTISSKAATNTTEARPALKTNKSIDLTATPEKQSKAKSIDLTLTPEMLNTSSNSKHRSNGSNDEHVPTLVNINVCTATTTSNTTIITTATNTNSNSSTATTATVSTSSDITPTNTTENQPPAPPPLNEEFQELLKACREADSSPDMEKLINNKLLKYYYGIHPDFLKSRGFRRNIRNVIERIRNDSELVFYHIKTIVEELKSRFKSKAVVITNTESAGTTGNRRTDDQIKKLNKALIILTKQIEKLEQSEVEWDDDDSAYLQQERYKKRALQVYEKICDLTGESKTAHRLVKKPIQFNGTPYAQFNKTLQGFINRTKGFPDFLDVLRSLEHCNKHYDYGLSSYEVKRIATEAFAKVGKHLQSRRKTDLYETVSHFTGDAEDPAAKDPILLEKLNDNKKHHSNIGAVLEKYARMQDLSADELKEIRLQEELQASTSSEAAKRSAKDNGEEVDDDDEETTEDDECEEEDVEKVVELARGQLNLTNGDISDAESDIEDTINSKDSDNSKLNNEVDKSKTETIAKMPSPKNIETNICKSDSSDNAKSDITKNENEKPATKNSCDKLDKLERRKSISPASALLSPKVDVTIDSEPKRKKTVDTTSIINDTSEHKINEHKVIPNGKFKVTSNNTNSDEYKLKNDGRVTDITTTTGFVAKVYKLASETSCNIIQDKKETTTTVQQQSNENTLIIQAAAKPVSTANTSVTEIVISDEET